MHKSNVLVKIIICSLFLGTTLWISSCAEKDEVKTEEVANNQQNKKATKGNNGNADQKSGRTVNTKYKTILPASLKKRMDAKQEMVILDVRTPAEVKEGKIEGSIAINYQDKDFEDQIAQLDKDKVYYVYCQSGGRSAKACAAMSDAGFTKLYNVRGGYNDWGKSK